MKSNPVITLRNVLLITLAALLVIILPFQLYGSYDMINTKKVLLLMNEGGRQRMLSQRVAKNLLRLHHEKSTIEVKKQQRKKIIDDLNILLETHSRLVSEGLFEKKGKLQTITYSKLMAMSEIINQVLSGGSQEHKSVGNEQEKLELYLQESESYLTLMDKVVKEVSDALKARISFIFWLLWGVMSFVIVILGVAGKRFLCPIISDIKKLFMELEESNAELELEKQRAEVNEQAIGDQAIKLLENKQLYEAIINTTHTVIITINTRGCIEVFNKAAETLFGYQQDEVEGRNIKMLMPEPYQSAHDGYLEAYLATHKKHIIDKEREVIGLKKDGAAFPLSLRVKKIAQGQEIEFVGFIKDLSAQKAVAITQKELGKSQGLYQSIVDDQDNLICRYGTDFKLTFVNKAYCAFFDKSKNELIGSSLLLLLPEDAANWMKLTHKTIENDSPLMQHEDKIVMPDGSEEWQSWTTRGICNEQGDVYEFQGVGTVITSRKNTELAILQAQKIAVEANKAKSLFLSNMSHELRTPLNSIIGFSQLLQLDDEEPLTDAQKESVDLIYKGGEHLLSLINEILDLSSIESGNIALSLEPVEIQGVVNEVIALMSDLAKKRDIHLTVKFEGSQPLVVMADYMRTKQVFINLLSNAIKYNNEKGEIEINVFVKEGSIHSTIKDTGDGISKKNQSLLFQPFSRIGTENTAIEGAGIGLSLCKGIISSMGGEIGVDSEVGKGSRFWFSLPIAEKTQGDQSANFAQQGEIELLSSEVSLKLLYIEDNPANMQLMRKVIKRLDGFTLFDAPNAEIGFEVIEQIKPEIILMDIDLPGLNGFQAFTEIQKRFDFADQVPIIAISANAMKGDVERGMELGFYAYLTKPLNIPLLFETLKQAIEGKK